MPIQTPNYLKVVSKGEIVSNAEFLKLINILGYRPFGHATEMLIAYLFRRTAGKDFVTLFINQEAFEAQARLAAQEIDKQRTASIEIDAHLNTHVGSVIINFTADGQISVSSHT